MQKNKQHVFKETDQGTHIRNDLVSFVSSDPEVEEENDFKNILKIVISICNKFKENETTTIKIPQNIQIAHHGNNSSKYVIHRDAKPKSRVNIDDDAIWLSQSHTRDRFLTIILYLTPSDWDITTDGGVLRCFFGCDDDDDDGKTAKEVVDIEPLNGRIVIFRSSKVLHEVLPCHRDGRFAATVWLLEK